MDNHLSILDLVTQETNDSISFDFLTDDPKSPEMTERVSDRINWILDSILFWYDSDSDDYYRIERFKIDWENLFSLINRFVEKNKDWVREEGKAFQFEKRLIKLASFIYDHYQSNDRDCIDYCNKSGTLPKEFFHYTSVLDYFFKLFYKRPVQLNGTLLKSFIQGFRSFKSNDNQKYIDLLERYNPSSCFFDKDSFQNALNVMGERLIYSWGDEDLQRVIQWLQSDNGAIKKYTLRKQIFGTPSLKVIESDYLSNSQPASSLGLKEPCEDWVALVEHFVENEQFDDLTPLAWLYCYLKNHITKDTFYKKEIFVSPSHLDTVFLYTNQPIRVSIHSSQNSYYPRNDYSLIQLSPKDHWKKLVTRDSNLISQLIKVDSAKQTTLIPSQELLPLFIENQIDYTTLISLYVKDSICFINSIKNLLHDAETAANRLSESFTGKEYISLAEYERLITNDAYVAFYTRLPELFPGIDTLERFSRQISLENARQENNRLYFESEKTLALMAFPRNSKDYTSFNRLTDKQIQAVLTDENAYLVISSAGSGKSEVIANKYNYLVQCKGLNPDSIRILAYTKATRAEMNKKKLNLNPEKGPARTFHSFASEILALGKRPIPDFLDEDRKRVLFNNSKKDHSSSDHSPRRAVLFDCIYKDETIWKSPNFQKALGEFAIRVPKKQPDNPGYLTFLTDRKGRPGSVRSYQEKRIFEFLALHGVEFDYEARSLDQLAKPDFTIYKNGRFVTYYEHFAISESEPYVSPFGDSYVKTASTKINQWKHLIFTTGSGKGIDEILSDLTIKLKSVLNSDIDLQENSDLLIAAVKKEKDTYLKRFGDELVKQCLDLYDVLRESCISLEEAANRCNKCGGYPSRFFNSLFIPIIHKYQAYLEENNLIDFTGIFEKAIEICDEGIVGHFPWDYVLVDEYQDISKLRYLFLQHLRAVNPNLKICAVGDDWQSIYSFANSDLYRFKDFLTDWSYATKIQMDETFRFNDPLLSISNRFILQGKDRMLINKTVSPALNAPLTTRIDIIQKDRLTLEDKFLSKSDELDITNSQIFCIAEVLYKESLKKTSEGITPEDCAFLYRYNNCENQIRNGFLGIISNNSIKKPMRDFLAKFIKHEKYDDCYFSMHRAKGIGRKYVFVVCCDENTIPSKVEDDELSMVIRKNDKTARDYEERRLFYVAITRAEVHTYLLYSGEPSKYVKEIKELIDETTVSRSNNLQRKSKDIR